MVDHAPNCCWTARRYFPALEEEWRLGRLSDEDDAEALFGRLLKQSRRIGLKDGHRVRTFHLRIASFKASPSLRRAAGAKK